MTNPYRAMCSELIEAIDSETADWEDIEELKARARALLAQPVAKRPTDEELLEMWHSCDWFDEGATLREFISIARAVLARWGRPTPQPPANGEVAAALIELRSTVMGLGQMGMHVAAKRVERAADLLERPTPQPEEGDIHYAWELHDAEGEWQAGGSANRLDDVQREGNRYLQTYSQDGPHKLIIQRHCVSTIEEVTND